MLTGPEPELRAALRGATCRRSDIDLIELLHRTISVDTTSDLRPEQHL
jgi:hypothetical protein